MLNALSTAYLQEFCTATLSAANAPQGTQSFNLTPPMETKLRQAIMQSDAFLGMISLLPVQQIKGQVIDVGDDGLSTGRSDTGRFSVEMGHSGNTYELTKTDSGAHILWETMTQWANSGSKDQWLTMMKNAISRRFALDMLRIGFNGTSIAAKTDPVANPLGQDVNKGWLKIVKEKAASQVLASADLDPTGATPDSYKNLDSLVQDLINTTIAPEHRQDPDLVVLVGSNLVAAEQHRLLEAADSPTEHKAAQSLAKTIAGKKAYTPPFFPADQIWVTNTKNLQILTQEGTQWRKQKNDEDELRFKQNHIRMEGYAVGNLKKFAAIEAVTVVDPAPAA
ncbi:Phage major capsid protein, P2 family [Vibrio crassostreae]|uniref:phage major capsid protein, P2 family n=1 Tax=Vibrio mediterranei TaxID=689 RepID=UPI00228504C8|nr:phage major capsid protein, P2 family [Vibrio mediterranei]CAK2191400.1 Phage major capsid protein, P2 family [Vibrio crassostreae]MCY9853157.1 phage major capsid protein, P2 family [Vibrio mediterranei]CAK2359778.1 Phage major capsid protein, P2 family [Vibrio crassostreae]CAK2434459.1 Phage major capsid protein, P2 family [Vibrio crassostreae]CAK3034725.1 Phage major capsid protein, P2 family [Vibrio crassostreae]